MTYNLLDAEWIPVLYHNGDWKRVGIRKALEDAGRIRQIAATNPMDRVAILRFLLAVLYWCKGNPPEQADAIMLRSFPPDWFSKLDDNRDCFNMLGDGKRFYQDNALRRIPAEHTTNYLMHEVPSGTNKWHFRHSTDKVNGLCPACCAMGLVRLPVFATSGGKGMTRDSGKSPGINSKPPLYFLQVGISLAATLWFSWHKTNLEIGTPEWETPNLQLPSKGEVPLMTGLTWLARRVWLDNPDDTESACISCGIKSRVIRRCVFDGKGSSKTEGRIWRDPQVIYVTSHKGDVISLHAGDALGASDAAAGQWARIAMAMLQQQGTRDCVAGNDGGDTSVVGFSTVQNDKYLEAIDCSVPFPCSSHEIEESVEKLERWQKEGSSLVRRVRPPKEKGASRKHVEIPPVLDAIRPHVESRVSAKVRELLAGGDTAWQEAAKEYGPMMDAIAQSLSPGFTTAAVERRKQIASAIPDMRPRTKTAQKQGRKRGGDK
jgi:hypothetical protein